jgi:hypothetical protein
MTPQENFIPYSALDSSIRNHVQEFSNVLLDKGYTNCFILEHEALSRVPERLTDAILNALNKQQDFTLFYCHGDTQSNRPILDNITISFMVNYTPEHGFKVCNMDITRKDTHAVEPINIKLQPVTNQEIPTPTQCDDLVNVTAVKSFSKKKTRTSVRLPPPPHKTNFSISHKHSSRS